MKWCQKDKKSTDITAITKEMDDLALGMVLIAVYRWNLVWVAGQDSRIPGGFYLVTIPLLSHFALYLGGLIAPKSSKIIAPAFGEINKFLSAPIHILSHYQCPNNIVTFY